MFAPYASAQKQQSSNENLDKNPPNTDIMDYPSCPPPHFWDNLSAIPLTKNALRELNRRNTENLRSQPSSKHQSRPPLTRGAVAAQQQDCPPLPAQEFFHQSSPADQDHVRILARHGGPDLKDLRGDCQLADVEMSPSRLKFLSEAQSMLDTAKTKSTGPYDCAFEQHLIDHNIFPDGFEYTDGRMPPEPENIDEIRRALGQRRASLSSSQFSGEDFRKFRSAATKATKETLVIGTVMPIIEGDRRDGNCVSDDVVFKNLHPLTDGSLSCVKPDIVYGAPLHQLHRKVRQELSKLIIPSTQVDQPVAPNNFVEVKGPCGSVPVATRQALYAATFGARGLQSLQSYGTAEPRYDDKAYTLAWTYHLGHLKAYAHHPIPPSTPGAQPGYVMTQVKSWSLTSDVESFRLGAAAYRNGRDWAKSQRDQAIAQANNKAASIERPLCSETNAASLARERLRGGTVAAFSQGTSKDPSLSLHHNLDTSEDELALDL